MLYAILQSVLPGGHKDRSIIAIFEIMKYKSLISFVSLMLCAGSAFAQNNTAGREYGNMGTSESQSSGTMFEALEAPESAPDFKKIENFSAVRLGTKDLDIYNPMLQSYGSGAWMTPFNGLTVIGTHSYSEQPFLLVTRSAAMGLNYTRGRFSASVSGTVRNQAPMGYASFNQFGVDAMLKYRLTPTVSFTAFGEYVNSAPYLNAALYPYIQSSRYGAYMTLENDRVGVDLGAQRYMDPMTGRMEIAPIVTPFIKFDNGLSIGVPVGGMIKNAYDRSHPREIPPPPPPQRR